MYFAFRYSYRSVDVERKVAKRRKLFFIEERRNYLKYPTESFFLIICMLFTQRIRNTRGRAHIVHIKNYRRRNQRTGRYLSVRCILLRTRVRGYPPKHLQSINLPSCAYVFPLKSEMLVKYLTLSWYYSQLFSGKTLKFM